jgi:regulator of replication initiation timing
MEQQVAFLQNQIKHLKDVVVELQNSHQQLSAKCVNLEKRLAHQNLPKENQVQEQENIPMKVQSSPVEDWTKVQSKKLVKKNITVRKIADPPQKPSVDPLKSNPPSQKSPFHHLEQIPWKSPPSIYPLNQPYLNATKKVFSQKDQASDRFKNALKVAPVETKIKMILKQPLPEEKIIDKISSIILNTNFSTKARTSPTLAWKILIKSWTDHYPLMISIINPNTAEIFYNSCLESKLKNNLSMTPSVKIIQREIGNNDISRRAKVYLTGYFKNLRLSTLQEFNQTQKSQLLLAALTILPTFIKDPALIRRWKKTIKFDVKDQNLILEEQMIT